jgi:hypothetical protein
MASTDFIEVQTEIYFCKPHLCLISLKTLENPYKCYTGLLYTQCFCIILCIVSSFVYSWLFPIFVQVY